MISIFYRICFSVTQASRLLEIAELSEKLDRHLIKTGAVIPVPNPNYDPDAVAPEDNRS